MNTKNTVIKNLSDFIRSLIKDAENDTAYSVVWFSDTKDEKFAIIGGWLECAFDDTDRDIFCISKSKPKYVMAIKIVVNDGQHAYCDFDTLSMPMDIHHPEKADDTSIILEWDMRPADLAEFMYGEWERITREHEGV